MLLTTLDEVKMIYKVSLAYDFKDLNIKIIQRVKFLVIYQYLWLYIGERYVSRTGLAFSLIN